MKCPFCIKVCNKCNRILVAYSGNFSKMKHGKYGLFSICKECNKSQCKQYCKQNADKIREYNKQYYRDNIDKIKAYAKQYDKQYYHDNIYKCKAYNKQYYDKYLADNGLERGQGSHGEQLVRKSLQDKGIQFVEQHTFPNCKYKYVLRYDFYLPSINTVIEYDGEQHYRPVEAWGGEEYYEECKIRDSIKETYCKEHNITLIRIPYYYEVDNIETIIAMLI